MNLYISYFKNPDKSRQNELEQTIAINLKNPFIKRIIMLAESDPPHESDKIVLLPTKKRPTYQDFFDLTLDYDQNEINIIANTDIIFDHTIEAMNNLTQTKAYALTRHEIRDGVAVEFSAANGCPVHFSQDVWAFRGHVKTKGCKMVMAENTITRRFEEIPFTMGVAGCDNVIANRLSRNYVLKNPYRYIICVHAHKSTRRPNYTYRITGNKSRWGQLTRVKQSEL